MNKTKVNLGNNLILKSENIEYENDTIKSFNDSKIGNPTNLNTTSKNVVDAVNEVHSNLSNLALYSTSETLIGKWINGKSIYRKVIDFGALPNNTQKNLNHNISNVDMFTNVYGIAYTSGYVYTYPLPLMYKGSDSNYNVELMVSKQSISMSSNTDRSALSAYVVLEYTKTS